jgi:hypothetical protein
MAQPHVPVKAVPFGLPIVTAIGCAQYFERGPDVALDDGPSTKGSSFKRESAVSPTVGVEQFDGHFACGRQVVPEGPRDGCVPLRKPAQVHLKR